MRKLIFFAVIVIALSGQLFGQNNRVAKSPSIRNDWAPGFVNTPELGYGISLEQAGSINKYNFYSITNVTGYQFTRNIKAGIGYGVQMHNSKLFFPFSGDVRASLSGQELVPFLAASGGVEVSPENFDSNSRIFLSGMLGIHYVMGPKIATDFSVGVLSKGGGTDPKATFFTLKIGVQIKGKRNDALK